MTIDQCFWPWQHEKGCKCAAGTLSSKPSYVFCCGNDCKCAADPCECQCHSLTIQVERLTRWQAEAVQTQQAQLALICKLEDERDLLQRLYEQTSLRVSDYELALGRIASGNADADAAQFIAREALAGSTHTPEPPVEGSARTAARALTADAEDMGGYSRMPGEWGVQAADETSRCRHEWVVVAGRLDGQGEHYEDKCDLCGKTRKRHIDPV